MKKFKGFRGLILVIISTIAVVFDQLQPIAEQVLSSDVTPAIAVGSVTAVKLIFTDAWPKIKAAYEAL